MRLGVGSVPCARTFFASFPVVRIGLVAVLLARRGQRVHVLPVRVIGSASFCLVPFLPAVVQELSFLVGAVQSMEELFLRHSRQSTVVAQDSGINSTHCQ